MSEPSKVPDAMASAFQAAPPPAARKSVVNPHAPGAGAAKSKTVPPPAPAPAAPAPVPAAPDSNTAIPDALRSASQLQATSSTMLPKCPSVDQIRITYSRSMLKKQTEEIANVHCTDSVKDENFINYVVQTDKIIFNGVYSKIYSAYNHQYSDTAMICRVFEPTALISPENSQYLRILRHLGKKHPYIVFTMDIFSDEGKRIYLFQEHMTLGNTMEYVQKGNVVNEPLLRKWAHSVYQAMGFLKNIGISHRAVQPRHIFLKTDNRGHIQAKLSSFRSAFIYWDPAKNAPIDHPALDPARRCYANYQPPEAFGRPPNTFDPIKADIWGLGATLYYLSNRSYVIDLQKTEVTDADIHRHLTHSRGLSLQGKQFLFNLLTLDLTKRYTYDQMPDDPWFIIRR